MKSSTINIVLLVLVGGIIGWFGYTKRDKLPTGAQLIFVLAEVFIIWRLYIVIKGVSEGSNYTAAINQTQTALDQLEQAGTHPSYGQAQYTTWANSLQQSLDGCGTGWVNMVNVFVQMKNDADVYALIKAYGVRTVDKCGLFTGDFNGDLTSTLTYKFSGVEQTLPGSISDINAILRKKGINVSF